MRTGGASACSSVTVPPRQTPLARTRMGLSTRTLPACGDVEKIGLVVLAGRGGCRRRQLAVRAENDIVPPLLHGLAAEGGELVEDAVALGFAHDAVVEPLQIGQGDRGKQADQGEDDHEFEEGEAGSGLGHPCGSFPRAGWAASC